MLSTEDIRSARFEGKVVLVSHDAVKPVIDAADVSETMANTIVDGIERMEQYSQLMREFRCKQTPSGYA